MSNDYKFIDPSTKRKNDIVKDKLSFFDGKPVFSILEFNIYGACNRSCDFCPVSNTAVYTSKHEKFDFELYKKIMTELVGIDYQGKILYSAFCEPLLNKDLEKYISLTKQMLPKARVEIVTNGDPLTVARLVSVFDAGLDALSISMYDGAHQIEKFDAMRKEANLDEKQVILRRRYFEDGNYGMTVSNRVGLVESNNFRDKAESSVQELPLKKVCFYPFYMLLVDLNGDVLLCPHDWAKRLVLGSLHSQSLMSIWNGEKLNGMRQRLSNQDRSFAPCVTCDVHGDVIGRESFEAWSATLEPKQRGAVN
jgi:radical SAM protein with 4Fe4S-binding SPASM domain